MRRSEEWFIRPDILTARERLDAQFIVLGCAMGSSRMDGLLETMVKYLRGEVEQLPNAVAEIAAKGPAPETVATLAEASWRVFTEPPQSLALEIDDLGVAKLLTPGAYGRLWCRQTVDAAWSIYAAYSASWRGASGIIKAPTSLPFR